MNLPNLLADDEHTAADDPYKRVMKTRKWVYISATVAILIAGGRYHEEGGNKVLLGVFSLPDFVFAAGMIAGLGYLMPLYLILVSQLRDVYSAVLDERLADQRLERLRDAIKRQASASEELDLWMSSWRYARLTPLIEAEEVALRRLNDAKTFIRKRDTNPEADIAELSDLWRGMSTTDLQDFLASPEEEDRTTWLVKYTKSLERQFQDAAEARRTVETAEPPENDQRLVLLKAALADANDDLHNLHNVRAYLSPAYRLKEMWIDTLRVVPPALTGVGALIALLVNFFQPIKSGVFGF